MVMMMTILCFSSESQRIFLVLDRFRAQKKKMMMMIVHGYFVLDDDSEHEYFHEVYSKDLFPIIDHRCDPLLECILVFVVVVVAVINFVPVQRSDLTSVVIHISQMVHGSSHGSHWYNHHDYCDR